MLSTLSRHSSQTLHSTQHFSRYELFFHSIQHMFTPTITSLKWVGTLIRSGRWTLSSLSGRSSYHISYLLNHLDYIIYLSSGLPSSVMPVSRLTQTLKKNQNQKRVSEIQYTEQKTRGGAVRYVAVNVPTTSTTSSTPPSTSRQSTLAPGSHLMDVDHIDNSLGCSQHDDPSKKSRKPTKVFCPSLYLFN